MTWNSYSMHKDGKVWVMKKMREEVLRVTKEQVWGKEDSTKGFGMRWASEVLFRLEATDFEVIAYLLTGDKKWLIAEREK
jgi:hypothetical protein